MRKGGGTVNHHWLSVSHTHTRTHTHTKCQYLSHSFKVSTLRERGGQLQAKFIGGKVKPHHLVSVSHTHMQAHTHVCTHTHTHIVSILILSLCFRVSTLREQGEQAEFIGGKIKFHSLCTR